MSVNRLNRLYGLAPGFKHDNDEEWQPYATTTDRSFLSSERRTLLCNLEEIDKLKSSSRGDDKDKKEEIQDRISKLTNSVNTQIETLIQKIPAIKANAIKAREQAIQADFPTSSRASDDDEDDYADPFKNDYLPRIAPPKKRPAQQAQADEIASEQVTAQAPSPSAESSNNSVDRYLEGVSEKDKQILLSLRTCINRYDCKAKVICALERLRKRDEIHATLDSINNYFKIQARTASKSIIKTTS